MNSRMSADGKLITNRNPAYKNNLGADIKSINIDGLVDPGQSELAVCMGSSYDVYYPTVLTTQIEQYLPDVQVKKSVRNITHPNAAKASEGDFLEYSINMKNEGFDTAASTEASDTLPAGVEYVPNSISYINNGQLQPRTDAAGDDEVEYSAQNNKLLIHVGNEATASKGSTLKYAEERVYTYRVRVLPKGMGTTISNGIEVTFKGGDGKTGGGNKDHTDTPTETPDPSLNFTKTTDKGPDYKLKANDTITYTFEVENTGNVTLSNLAIDDEIQGLSKVALEKTTLAPGEKTTATATYKVTQADVDKSSVQNTATITANPPTGRSH